MGEIDIKACIMEMWGVFALCYIGGMSTFWTTASAITGAMAHMLALGIMIYVGAATSGAHFNPAVSFAMLITRREKSFIKMLMYMVFQFLGGFLAGFMVWIMSLSVVDGNLTQVNGGIPAGPGYAPKWSAMYCTSFPAVVLDGDKDKDSFIKVVRACVAEFIATFFLAFMVWGTAVDQRCPRSVYGFAIGGVVAMSAVGIGKYSGAALNPARWLGPWIVGLWGCPGGEWYGKDNVAQSGEKSMMTSAALLVYTIFPIAGGATAGLLYENVFLDPEQRDNK